jgi:hypothetical protein
MENNESKHSPLPWKLTDSHKKGIVSDGMLIASLYFTKNLDELNLRLDGESWLAMRDRTKKEREFYTKIQPEANAEFIVTACNSHNALKKENEELSTQLAKANSDKEKLGEAIKAEAKEYIKLSNTWRNAQMIQDANVAEENAKKLIDLLTDCGITL